MADYRAVHLPTKMINRIEEIIGEREELGYTSNAEFVKDAVRKHILELEKHQQEE